MEPSLREFLGQRVRSVWIKWAEEQPEPKWSWLVPWKDLKETDKEADRMIGEDLYQAGYVAANAGHFLEPDPESAAPLVLEAARALAREFPCKSVDLSIYASVYHTPVAVPDSAFWTAKVGHADSCSGRTLAELLTAVRALGSPHSKLKEAAELRRRAEALEHEANIKLYSIPPQEQPHA